MSDSAIRLELSRLEDANGRITPQAVIDAARPKDSPLHGYFEWDNRKAGDSYRLIQARQIIRRVMVFVEREPSPIRVTAYVHDPEVTPGLAQYRNIHHVAREPDVSRAVAVAEISAAASHLRRARELALALSYPLEDFDRALESLAALQRRADELPADGRPN